MSPRLPRPAELLDAAAAGDRVALARLLSVVERGGEASSQLARLVYAVSPPYTIGITGAPGSGKSTITNQLVTLARGGAIASPAAAQAEGTAVGTAGTEGAEGKEGTGASDGGTGASDEGTWAADEGTGAATQVGVLAVDPSSPFSGGAILGDRIRMQSHATDPSVFIRSMATRGHLGGLALAVPEALRVLGAAGFPLVVVETVGVGQMEVEIASAADTTVVVVTPGWGDAMQANKAGLLEIADLFVVNKADRPGVNEARRDLQQMLDLSAPSDWRPPVLTTVASNGDGVDELWAAVARHRAHLERTGALDRRREARLAQELRRVLTARALEEVRAVGAGDRFDDAVRAIADGRLDPYRAAAALLGERSA